MTEAIRRLPLNLTRFAALGVSETRKVLRPITSRRGGRQINRVGSAAGDDEQVARPRGVGSAEYGRRDEALATVGMRLG